MNPDDQPRPFEWREMASVRLWLGAVIVFAGLVAFLALVFALVPGPSA